MNPKKVEKRDPMRNSPPSNKSAEGPAVARALPPTCYQGVALARGNPSHVIGEHAPDDNAHHRGRDGSGIDNGRIDDAFPDGRRDGGPRHGADDVKNRRHNHGVIRRQYPRRDDRGYGVGSICPAVDELSRQDQRQNRQNGQELLEHLGATAGMLKKDETLFLPHLEIDFRVLFALDRDFLARFAKGLMPDLDGVAARRHVGHAR